MSRPGNKNLLIIIAVLLLTNIGVLGYFLWYKKPVKQQQESRWDSKGNSNGIYELLQKDVGFSADQLAQYKLMKDKQRETLRPMFDEMRRVKDSLFRLLKESDVPDSISEKAADQIGRQQKMLDLQTYTYFRKVRSLCTADQLPKYDSLIQNMFSKMGKPQRKSDSDTTKTDKKN
jgi:hypothetical protein